MGVARDSRGVVLSPNDSASSCLQNYVSWRRCIRPAARYIPFCFQTQQFEKMFAGRREVILAAVPPLTHFVEGVVIIIDNNQTTTGLDPFGQWFVDLRAERFHALVAQEQDFEAIEVFRDGQIF